MLRLTPFLLFDGNCAEAMNFYRSCFGGDLVLTRLGETPMKAQYPQEQHHKITYAQLTSGPVAFSATDWLHPTRQPQQGNMTAMYVTGEGRQDLEAAFQRLGEGADAELLTELQETPFGTYGRLTDRYGVEWFFRGQR